MKKSKNTFKNVSLMCLGLLAVCAGVYMIKNVSGEGDLTVKAGYILIGLGSGIFGHFLGNIISSKAVSGNQEIESFIKIAKNDERNIMLAEKAKAKAFTVMTYSFASVLLCLALISSEVYTILILVCLYIALELYAVYWRIKLEKQF